jgi:hypothetical protein
MEMVVRSMETAETAMEISPTLLGFSVLRLYIGEEASSGVAPGLFTPRRHGQGLGHVGLV